MVIPFALAFATERSFAWHVLLAYFKIFKHAEILYVACQTDISSMCRAQQTAKCRSLRNRNIESIRTAKHLAAMEQRKEQQVPMALIKETNDVNKNSKNCCVITQYRQN